MSLEVAWKKNVIKVPRTNGGSGEGSFVQIVSMIKPFSLQLDSLWRLYGLRK